MVIRKVKYLKYKILTVWEPVTVTVKNCQVVLQGKHFTSLEKHKHFIKDLTSFIP